MEDRILLVDDDPDALDVLHRRLTAAGFARIRSEGDPLRAAERFEQGQRFDLALIDLNMPEMNGMELLDRIKGSSPNTACIIVTAVNEVAPAVNCLKKGAYDYLLKPVARDTLIRAVQRALERKHLLDILDIDKQKALPRLVHSEPFRPIVTRSRNVLKVLKEAELHAHSDVPILITGESGTGKELLAQAIHGASARSDRRLTTVNMAALTPGLFDAEFFGHTRGAFTGAESDRTGYLEHTDGGTLFLDEIGILPLELQGKLLRVLQNGEYTKIGTNSVRRADVRIIAATNEDMEQLIDRKRFRQDLYYRLRGGWLHLPPLRERRADIPPLINTFLAAFQGKQGRCKVDLPAMTLLMNYTYPGNIRELRAIIQSAVNLARDGVITAQCLPDHLVRKATRPAADPEAPPEQEPPEIQPLAAVEAAHIRRTYTRLNRNKSKSARALGIGLNTLRRKLERYGIS